MNREITTAHDNIDAMAALQNNPFGSRPYKANLTGRFRFDQGVLKGAFVGGAARFLIKEKGKEQLDWTLTFQLFSLQGLPDRLTTKAPVDRMEISTQSLQLVRQRQRHTHEAIVNPYSPEFAERIPPPAPQPKKIPVPHYAE